MIQMQRAKNAPVRFSSKSSSDSYLNRSKDSEKTPKIKMITAASNNFRLFKSFLIFSKPSVLLEKEY